MTTIDRESLADLLEVPPSSAAAEVAGVTPVDCPVCGGEGLVRVNPTRNRDGVWDCDEGKCVACAGTGQLPAVENYTTYVLPRSNWVSWKCSYCECTVSPTSHLPGSEDCRMAADERAYSQADD